VLFIRPASAYIGIGLVLSVAGIVVPENEHIASEVKECASDIKCGIWRLESRH
jgi:hypothetical protein